MEQMLHLAKTFYIQHTFEMILGLLACILILMIINLLAVRRCRKQVRILSEKNKGCDETGSAPKWRSRTETTGRTG